ncbi:uncharacterized protein LOC141850252 isoform X2 [Brevipalpus obovatus]
MDTTSPIPPASHMDDMDDQSDSAMSPTNDQESSSSSPSTPSQPTAEINKLFVKNIGYNTGVSMKSFSNFYRDFFDKNFGSVSQFYVVKDHVKRISRGYGFVTFKDSSIAQKALNASEEELTVNLTPLLGESAYKTPIRTLKVFPAQEKLMSRVRTDVETQKQFKEEEMQRRDDIVSKIISGEVKREPIQEEQESESCGIHRLSDAEIQSIFNYLDDLSDLVCCGLVCKKWNAISEHVWLSKQKLALKDTFFSFQGPVLNKENLFMILKKCPALKELDLDESPHLDEVTFNIIAECCPKLERLIFRQSNLTKISLNYLADHCPALKAIDLSNSSNLTEKKLWEFLKVANGLEYLNLSGNWHITGKCFYHLWQLKELDIRSCGKIIDGSFEKLAQKCHSSLEKLRVGPVSRASLSIICENFRNLTTLELENLLEDATSNVFNLISKLKKLEYLHITSPLDGASDGKFKKFLRSCPKLKTLIIPLSHSLTDDGISRIADFCKNMTHLDISSSQITSQSLDSLAHLNSLKSLSLKYTKVTDEGIGRILKECRNLTFLNVDQCDLITVQTLLNAYDLMVEGLLDKRFTILYCGQRVKISSLDSRQAVHEFENYLEEDMNYFDEEDDLDEEFIDHRVNWDDLEYFEDEYNDLDDYY